MIIRRLRFTATARQHLRSEKQWWLENRTYPDVFADELEQALRIISTLPGTGTAYPGAGIEGLRRVFLRKSACHVYYTYDDREVAVRAVWGARRERGPRFIG